MLKNIFSKVLLIFIFLLLLTFPCSYASSSEYVINGYNVDMKVNENNTFDITENISVDFITPKHGIERQLPLINNVKRSDNTNAKNRAKISNVSVNEKYKVYKKDSKYHIKIGSENTKLTGNKYYTISYNYNIGRDQIKDKDELYFNIIGYDWDTSINGISFHITMPKEFDESKIGFSAGAKGTIGTEDVTYSVNGNEIFGTYNKTLESGEALTIRIELPEGYFNGSNFDIYVYLKYVVPIIFVIISFILWIKFGKDDPVIETVEFYPPEGINSLEASYLYKGKVEAKDVTSLLIYLANKGYLKIVELERGNFKIVKLKDYDGNKENEESFLDGLFYKAKMENGETFVTKNDLYNKFYKTTERIITRTNSQENKEKIFGKLEKVLLLSFILIIMCIITYLMINIDPVLDFDSQAWVFSLIFPMVGFTTIVVGIFSKLNTITRFFLVFFGLMFGGITWALFVLPIIIANPIYLSTYILGISCILAMILLIKFMPKRNKYGNEMLGKLKGFKNFLEISEKEELELMVQKDPTYFYNILPYAYVLGVSNKWIKKFEEINIKEPDWYSSSSEFDKRRFDRFINSMISSIKYSVSTSTSNSSSSYSRSSSGGSISGGGYGGGGGRSW